MGKKKKQKRKQAKAIKIKYAIKAKEAKKVIEQEKELFPHFRHQRNRLKHPALILGNSENKISSYDYRDCSHTGGSKYVKIENNPKPTDNEPMHISKTIESKAKSRFSKDMLQWDMSKVPDDLKQKNSRHGELTPLHIKCDRYLLL